MASIPGLKADVYFGDAQRPLPDWRMHASEHESDDDDLSPGTIRAVCAMLGFDPREEDVDESIPTYADLLEAVKREKGEVWKGPSGRWFTVNQSGRVVPARAPDQGEKSSKKTPVKKADKADPVAIRAHIDQMRKEGKASPEHAKKLAESLMGLTVAQLGQLKKDLGLKASGVKAELAKKLAERALASAGVSKPEKKKEQPRQEREKPEAPKETKPVSKEPAPSQQDSHKILQAVLASKHGFLDVADLHDQTGIPLSQLHATIQDLRRQGILSGSGIEGRHGMDARVKAAAIKDPSGELIGSVSVRTDAEDRVRQMLAGRGEPVSPATKPDQSQPASPARKV